MNDIIIHISDLHISDASERYVKMNKDTLLSTKNEDNNTSLIDSLASKINEIPCIAKYLVITGDIVNIAEKIEFEEAFVILTRLIKKLDIEKNNILLVPGDHEIHRLSILNELDKTDREAYLLNDAKYSNFLPFYKKLMGKEFDGNKIIFDSLEIGDIKVLGVNSNYKVSHQSSDGFIPTKQFDEEMNNLKSELDSKHLILAVHHNISGTYQDKRTGQWDKENRKNLIPYFQDHGVKLILHGNEHTPKSEKLDSTDIYVSDSGAMAGKDPRGSVKVYEIVRTENAITLKNSIVELRKVNAITEPNQGDWVIIKGEELQPELASFDIYIGTPDPILETLDIPSSSDESSFVDNNNNIKKEISPIVFKNEMVQKRLYNIVKEKKLFHSGHFHWSESSRAHNWIDVAKLLENNSDLYFVKSAVVDLIEDFNLNDKCNLIIGLGVEGNIISAKASIYFGIPQVSLPYSYRYDESHEYEKKLNYDNSKCDFENVIIISDVINDGRTLRKLIGGVESDFFINVKRVIVISLFYTGQEELNVDILNTNKQSDISSKDDDFEVNNIEFYAITSLRVEKCPYGKEYKSECLIYRDELSCVHLFYEEKT